MDSIKVSEEIELYGIGTVNHSKSCKIEDSFTDWKNEPTLEQLQEDYNNALPYHKEYIDKLNKYSLAMDGGSVPDKVHGRSRYRSKTIRKQAEWNYPLLEEPILNSPNIYEIQGTTLESLNSEKPNSELLNYQWNTQIDKVYVVNTSSRNFANEGTAIIKLGWEFDSEEVYVEKEVNIYAETQEEILKAIDNMKDTYTFTDSDLQALSSGEKKLVIGKELKRVKELVITKNHPTFTPIDNASLVIDPSCKGDKKKIGFVVEEIEVGFDELKKNEYREITTVSDKGNEVTTTVGHYKNLDAVQKYINKTIAENKQRIRDNGTDISSYNIDDPSRFKLTIYEYWGYYDIHGTGKLYPIVATWVDNILIRLEENPYAHKEIPYSFSSFMPVKDSIHGEPNAALLIDDQDVISSTHRAIQDITARGATGQEFINEDLFINSVQRDNYLNGKTVFFRGNIDPRIAIHRRTPDDIPPSMLTTLQMHQTEAEHLTGIIPYNHGNPNARGSGISTNKTEDDATTQRDMGILRRFINMFEDLGRKTLLLNQEYITDDTIIRLHGNSEPFRILSDKDLQGRFNIQVNVATLQKNDSTANKIITMMQTNAASMHPKLATLHYYKIAKLWNQEDLADSIISMENEAPSEQDQIMQQLQLERYQLENKKLRMELLLASSKIEETANRYGNEMSEITKEQILADVEYRKASAEKLRSQSELFNQELEYIASGLKLKEEMLHNEYQHAANLEREKVRTDRELNANKLKHEQALQAKHDYAIKEHNKNIQSTLFTDTADGSKQKYSNIYDNNNVDILEEINKVKV